MKPFSLLIKPASADCNLSCDYCFYLGKSALYPETAKHRMSENVLDALIRKYMETPQPQYVFVWQGGEPTLMRVDFFERVVSLQMRYGAASNAMVANAVQTNAAALTVTLARLFAAYNFLTGVSLDGPADIHDAHRAFAGGRGTFESVMRGIDTLRGCGAAFNTLTLVTDANVRRAADVYNFLVENEFYFQQYIPCVERLPGGAPAPYSISGPEWGGFLCALFDLWHASDTRRVSIRLFDAILSKLVTGDSVMCGMDRRCDGYFVVEYNGDVYPCDFFVDPELLIGNIARDGWRGMQTSRKYLEFIGRKKQWSETCGGCEWLEFCAGDCLKHRMSGGQHDPQSPSALCLGWKQFYAHAMPRLRALAETIKFENHG